VHRIVTGVFDDPQRPSEEQLAADTKRDLELKHEKSRKSLAQIYEEEYMRRVEGVEPDDVQEENAEVRAKKEHILHKVASTLRTLNMMSSLFNYIAAPVAPGSIKSLSSASSAVPSISMEDKVPLTAPENVQKAPEEIMPAVRALPVGSSEQSSEERKQTVERSTRPTSRRNWRRSSPRQRPRAARHNRHSKTSSARNPLHLFLARTQTRANSPIRRSSSICFSRIWRSLAVSRKSQEKATRTVHLATKMLANRNCWQNVSNNTCHQNIEVKQFIIIYSTHFVR
jgi:U3 small nucleolar ribonucleoprotein component